MYSNNQRTKKASFSHSGQVGKIKYRDVAFGLNWSAPTLPFLWINLMLYHCHFHWCDTRLVCEELTLSQHFTQKDQKPPETPFQALFAMVAPCCHTPLSQARQVPSW